MPYEIDTSSFFDLRKLVLQLPDEIIAGNQCLEPLFFCYLSVVECQLALTGAIVRQKITMGKGKTYMQHFLPVFDKASGRILILLENEIGELLDERTGRLVEFAHAIRGSEISSMLEAQVWALEKNENTIEIKEHLDIAVAVTESIFEQVEKYAARKWIGSVHQTLTAIIDIAKRN